MSLLVSRLRDLRGTTHRVRWQVDGREKNRTFATRALADSFRSDLSAARRGEPFDTATGLPVSLRPKATGPTWLAHAKALVDAKWGESSPAHRKSTAAALVTISCALTRDGVTYRDPKTPRAAPSCIGRSTKRLADDSRRTREVCGSPGLGRTHLTPAERPCGSDHGSRRTRRVRPSAGRQACCRVRRDTETRRSVPRARVRRRTRAPRRKPLKRVKTRRRAPSDAVDSRTVINPSGARTSLASIADDRPDLHALFACLYFAALRPSEARNLRRSNLIRPRGDAWGEIVLAGSYDGSGAGGTDSGKSSAERELKHRAPGDTPPHHSSSRPYAITSKSSTVARKGRSSSPGPVERESQCLRRT